MAHVPGPDGDARATTCSELLARLEDAGIELRPPGDDTAGLLLEARDPQALVPLRFELRVEERPVVVFARRDGQQETAFTLDGRVAEHLRRHFSASPIHAPEVLVAAAGTLSASASPADLLGAADALRALEADDLRVRRLELLREALLRADLGSVDSTLGTLLDALLDLTEGERGSLFLVENGVPLPRLHRDRTGSDEAPVLPRRVLERALERRAVFSAEDTSDDAELYRDTVAQLHIKSLLVAPFQENGEVRALVYVDRRLSATTFSPETIALFAELASDLWRLLAAALERDRLATQIARLQAEEPIGEFRASGRSAGAMLAEVRRAATTRQPILLLGETGTGKTLLAEGIHRLSPWARGPFVRVRVPEIAENLFESEVFGHERGAFTGAVAARRGLLAEADGGTLFLDEAGRLSAAMQAKLLGVIEGETAVFRRVGGSEQRSRFRLIAATSADLEAEVRAGRFLPDLWWRLSAGLVARIPPLRERPEDLPMLAEHLLRQISVAEGFEPARLEATSLAQLARHSWPGNVRELKAVVQRAFWRVQVRDDGPPVVRPEDLNLDASPSAGAGESSSPWSRMLEVAGYTTAPGAERDLGAELEAVRAWHIRSALEACDNNEAEAARRLGFRAASTFRSQLQRLRIKVERRLTADGPG